MKKRFGKVNIEISNICNLQCSFCPEVIREKQLMSLKLFEQIIEQVTPLTEQVCFHLMGDPLVHPQLEQLVQICEKYQTKIFFVTNGVLMTERKSQLLLSPAFRQVNFSLHSFHDNHPDKDPTEYLRKIFQFTHQALAQRPDLYLNFRLWNLENPMGANLQNQELLRRISDEFKVNFALSSDIRRNKSLRITGRLYLHFDTEFVWPDIHLPILGTKGTCYGLSSHFGILVDGTVVPCCLDKEGKIPLGKIQDMKLLDILDSPRSKSLIKGFKQNKLIEELCQRCQYIDRFSASAHYEP